jgi:hypothetical protein
VNGVEGFIGDYYGDIVTSNSAGLVDVTTLVSTYNDGSNPAYRQQPVIAKVAVP